MCYSAQIERDWRKYLRVLGTEATLGLEDFIRKYWWRQHEFPSMKIPKAVDAWFANPRNGDEQEIANFIEDFNEREATKLQQELFKQKKRLADAKRALENKETKKALEDRRISTDKIAWALGKLNDLKQTEIKDRDSYIFPGYFAPVIVSEDGKRVIKLMRYQCRPAGKPKLLDKQLETFNARRDNLGGTFWKPLFGYSHGIMIVNLLFEEVSKAKLEGRELKEGEDDPSATLDFRPKPAQESVLRMLVFALGGRRGITRFVRRDDGLTAGGSCRS